MEQRNINGTLFHFFLHITTKTFMFYWSLTVSEQLYHTKILDKLVSVLNIKNEYDCQHSSACSPVESVGT